MVTYSVHTGDINGMKMHLTTNDEAEAKREASKVAKEYGCAFLIGLQKEPGGGFRTTADVFYRQVGDPLDLTNPLYKVYLGKRLKNERVRPSN